ncbi:MAG: glycosyltransferase family 2 protein [Butyrivibrio sp.]|nr:glycosyltransferase family 2 protein [Butyrivibrio sp.]
MSTISVCMIVKNEEKRLAKCLDCLKTLADEIIIVDTGSTDKTKEIAQGFGAKIYDFEWCEDFAAARNFAFSKASCEYIYSADADEELDEENIERFRFVKEALSDNPEVDIVQMYYCNQLAYQTVYNYDKEYRPKLYKRVRNFVWEDRIHEKVRLNPVVFDSDVEIMHYPSENHAARDLSLFRKQIGEGEPISSRMLGMYARELMMAGTDEDFYKSEEFFEQVCLDDNRSLDDVKQASVILVHLAVLKDDIEKLLKYAIKDIASESSSEVCYELGNYYENHGDIDEAIIWYYNAAYETEPIIDIKKGSEMPVRKLVSCYRMLGNEEQAVYYEGELVD